MDILDTIEELEVMGEEGERWYCKVFPFLWGKTAVDASELFEALGQLRAGLPEELTAANEIARDREKIVGEAHDESAKILEAAREQAQLLISNDELVKHAQRKGEDVIKQSQIEADAIRSEAEAWARDIIDKLDNYITRTHTTLEKARSALTASSRTATRPETRPPREPE